MTQPGKQPEQQPDLANITLQLSWPDFHYGNMKPTAWISHGEPIVTLLSQLHQEGIDRSDQPVIATFLSRRYQGDAEVWNRAYESGLADSIVEGGTNQGLRLVVEAPNGIIHSEYQPPPEQPRGWRLALDGLKRLIGGKQPEEPAIAPDFYLRISAALDESSLGMDSNLPSGQWGWSYKNLEYTVAIVHGSSEA
ncbi:MAG: hypothetical protein ACREGD_04870 [Candidatus Saccharimonadales bacterium]